MELREFTKKVCSAMEKELGGECRVEQKEIRKNNGVVFQGLMITAGDRNVIPTIYLDPFWEACESGVDFAEIVRRLAEICRKEISGKNIDMNFFRDFEKVKDRICYRLVGKKANGAMFSNIPHIDFLDLAICFFYAYQGNELGEGSILIHNSHMELWHTNTLELLKLAEKNTPRLFPYRVFLMGDMLEGLIQEQEESKSEEEDYRKVLNRAPMYILSNRQKSHGAACILYENVLERQADKYGGSFYILPSSVHEVILLLDSGEESVEDLRNMVREVNRTQVSPDEVLSDSLYYYDFVEKGLRNLG